MKRLISALIFGGLAFQCQAHTEALNSTLVRVINQLNAVLPLLDEAADEVQPDSRITLHIDAFEGADGRTHPGVRQDVLHIRDALIAYINRPVLAPKTVRPLALDYVGKQG